jgi:hypothetical protein
MTKMTITQTEENLREIKLATGNTIRIRREDPYGLWSFSFANGPIPKELEGSFTRPDLAVRHLNNVIESGKYNPAAPPERVPVSKKIVSKAAQARADELNTPKA